MMRVAEPSASFAASPTMCWSSDQRGLLVIFVPHYFLGNYCALSGSGEDQDNEAFIRELIAGRRRKSREELFAVCERLDVAPTFIKLDTPVSEEPRVLDAVEQLVGDAVLAGTLREKLGDVYDLQRLVARVTTGR